MNTLLLSVDWEAIGAVSKIILAVIAVITLGYNIYLVRKQDTQRREDTRARVACYGVIGDQDGSYLLKVENIGKEPAFNVNLRVTGKPIENSLYEYIRTAYEEMQDKSFTLYPGQCIYFYIYPSSDAIWRSAKFAERDSNKRSQWLDEHNKEVIHINGSYNNQYAIEEQFTIQDLYINGSFMLKDTLVYMASLLSEINQTQKEELNIYKEKRRNG